MRLPKSARRPVPGVDRSTWDVGALCVYCENRATFDAAAQQVAAEGLTLTSARGVTRPHPAIAIMHKSGDALRLAGELFGLSPHARNRLTAHPIGGEFDDLDAILGGPLA